MAPTWRTLLQPGKTLLQRRWLHRLLVGLAVVLTLFVVAVGAAHWRLSQGPVDLGFLESRMDKALQGTGDAPSIQVRNPVLTWGGWHRPLDLRAGPLRAIDREGRIVALVDEVSFGLAFPELLRGTIAPTRIEVSGLDLHLVRVEDGRFALGFDAPDRPAEIRAQSSPEAETRFLGDLLNAPDPASPLAQLTRIHILDSGVSLEDRVWHRSWRVENADLRLERSQNELEFSFEVNLPRQSEDASIRTRASYDRASGRLDASLELVAVDMPGLTDRIPGLEILAMFDHPAGVSMSLSVEPILAHADSMHIELHRAEVDLGDLDVSIRGSGELRGSDIEMQLTTSFGGISVAAMNRYWPSSVAPEVREWLTTNIPTGDLRDLEIHAEMILPARPEGRFETISTSGTFAFEDLSVAYLQPLPPLEDLVGTGSFRIPDGIELEATQGRQGDIVLERAQIVIGPLTGFTRLELHAEMWGPLRSAMRLLDAEPLELLDDELPQAEQFSGRVDAQLELDIPLSGSDPTPLSVSGTARTTAAGVVDWPWGYDITAAKLDVAFDLMRVEFRGEATVNGAVVDLQWWESLVSGPLQRRGSVRATLDDPDRLALGIPDSEVLAGPLGVELELEQAVGSSPDIDVVLDLTPTTLAVPRAGWSKPAGVFGEAKLQATIGAEQTLTVEHFDITAGDLRATGRLSLAPELSGLRELVVDQLQYAGNDLSGRIARKDDGAILVRVAGSRFDLRTLLTPEHLRNAEDHAELPILDFEAQGELIHRPEEISLRDLSLRHRNSDLRGNLILDRRGTRPRLTVECWSDTVDVRPYMTPVEKRTEEKENEDPEDATDDVREDASEKGYAISDEPLEFPLLDRYDASIRWRVDTYYGPTARGSNLDVGVELHDGNLRIDPFLADRGHDGSVSGYFELQPRGEEYAVNARLQITDGRLQVAVAKGDSSRWPVMDLEMDLESHGRSLHELASHANGQASLVLEEGILPRSAMNYLASDILVSLFQTLDQADEKADDTQLECAVLMFRLSEGELVLKPFALQSVSMTVVGGGKVDLATEQLRLDWITKPRQGVGLSASTLTNRNIRLGGTLSKPSIEVRPLDAAVTTGVAVATMGLSLVARGLFDRITADQDVCAQALEEAGADADGR